MATDVDTNALNEFANGSSGFITGGITGLIMGTVIGFIAKDKLFNNKTDLVKKQRELDAIYANNEKLSKRNKELERQVEDLLSELNKVRKQAKSHNEDRDDLEDELDKFKREVKNLRLQNNELARKVKEYKTYNEAKDAEIILLKEKLG